MTPHGERSGCEVLVKFYESATASGLPEAERLTTTVSTWSPQICAAITTEITDACGGQKLGHRG